MFSWLLYDSPRAREQWPRYLHELRTMGIPEERLRSQLRCRLIPAELGARGIDWRVSIFGDQIALCSYAPDHAVGLAGAQTFTLDAPGELKQKFVALFDACPDIGAAATTGGPAELERARNAHVALKTAFLRSFAEGLPTDIMLHRLEDAAESSNVMLEQTRLLIWIGVLTLVAVIITFAVTQFKLT
ncbi:MAG TPA: hypothetical protein VGV89_04155 [Thermoplasmata archaeon]|nr:hypothetical protein [Thermoplasmata archaeon]